jgi:ketosteroid isomerase-like protein
MAISTGPLEDRVAIRELHDSYGDAVFRRDAAAWGENWAPDATWNLMGNDFKGRQAIVELWNHAMGGFTFVGFFTQQGPLTITGNTAHGIVYTNEVLEQKDGKLFRQVGMYTDEYVKTDGRWYFARRAFKALKEN